MNEQTIGREPVQILEVIVPKCSQVHGVSPCAATQTGGAKCFNTANTCNDIDNFTARPLAHILGDLELANGASIASGDIDRTADILVQADVRFAATPSGTIWEQGGSADRGAYLGVTGTDLVFRAGDGTVASGAGVGRVSAPLAGFAGRTVQLIGEIDLTNGVVRLWEFDPVEYVLKKIGEDSFIPAADWAGTDAGAIGQDGGSNIVTGEDGGDFNGGIASVTFYEGRGDADLNEDPDAFRFRYFFDDGRKATVADKIYVLPLLQSVGTVGTRLNITGSDQRYEPLGRRATLSATFADAPHSDFPFDPYLADRGFDPLTRSTFWAKWIVRHKFGKTRAICRLYSGYDGDRLSDMQVQTYVVDRLVWQGDRAQLNCRDYLSLTEFRRAQVPVASGGQLSGDVADSATSITLEGDRTGEYPASGTLRIGDELMTFTGAPTYDEFSDLTTISSITRGTDGSVAEAHDEGAAVQVCRRYEAARIQTVLEDLLINDAAIPAQLVDLAKIISEDDEFLDAYSLTTLISEPTGVDQLIGEIAEQCSFYIWWNERRQMVDMQAIKALASVDTSFTQEANIVGDSFKFEERPKERITTISLYYNPRNFAGDLASPTNFQNQLVVSNSTVQNADRYGRLPQTRQVFSRWLTTQAQLNQTGSRYSLRYADVPFYATFLVDAKDRQFWVGDFCTISHDFIVNEFGARDVRRRWLIIEAEEVEPGHAQQLRCVDITLDGTIYLVTEDGIGPYTEELFFAGNAFITDNNGLNPDGSTGATIG
jgi:hypothetical protein